MKIRRRYTWLTNWRPQRVISFFFPYKSFLISNGFWCQCEGCRLLVFYSGSRDWVGMLTKLLAQISKIIFITGWNYAMQSIYSNNKIFFMSWIKSYVWARVRKRDRKWGLPFQYIYHVFCLYCNISHLRLNRAIFDQFCCISLVSLVKSMTPWRKKKQERRFHNAQHTVR